MRSSPLLLVLLLAACGSDDTEMPPSAQPGTGPVAGPDIAAHTFDVRGVYLGAAYDSAAAVVSHETVPGFMDAMRMPIRVSDRAVLRGLEEGDTLLFTIADPDGDGFRIQRVEPLPPGTELELAEIGADAVTPEASLSGEATDGDAERDLTPQPVPNPDAGTDGR